MNLLEQIDLNNTPEHVAIIMDGNGRWAKKQGQIRLYGHNFGVESVREVLKAAKEMKIKYLTLYAFSTENWNRPKEEVEGLMDLLIRTIAGEVDELNEGGVRLMSIGNIEGLPEGCREELKKAQTITSKNKEINLVLALNYSSRWEITNAVHEIAAKIESGELKANDVNELTITNFLSTNSIPDPELLIRTSGEHRISNFLLWQIAYTELYFTEVLWPDFKKEDFYKAILDYQSRERRFGMVSEQITK
ncbi:MAG: isoprenyl transferase [Flavobacteriia bacterium]|nr:isoprenyl transferase [Flavobacteriia bacterium]